MIIIICDYCKKNVEKVTGIKNELIVKFHALPYQGHGIIVSEQSTPVIHTTGQHICDDCRTQLTELLTKAIEHQTNAILSGLAINDG